MKIAIMSDSHGSLDRLEQSFANISRAGIKNVLHAGDFLVDGVAEIFAGFPELQFFISVGNNDVNSDLLLAMRKLPNVKIDEVVFCEFKKNIIGISHYDGVAESKSHLSASLEINYKKVDIFIHGHTHRPTVVRREKSTMLNPGALCEDGRYLILDLKTMKGQRVFFSDKLDD
jgi:putative phosphoesterase